MSFLNYFKALRLPFITTSGLNFILFWFSLSKQTNEFFYYGLAGIILAHLVGNLWNDYFDFDSDKQNTSPTPFSGGSRLLQNHQISKKNFFIFSLIISLLALVIGLIILIKMPENQIQLILLIGISGLLTFFYTAPPLKLVYRGIGDITLILTFGPLLLIGISYMNQIHITTHSFIISLIFGLLTARILFINQILDYIPDMQTGKRTLANLIPQNKVRYFISLFSLICGILLFIVSQGLILYLSLGVLILSELLILFVNQPLFWAGLGIGSHFIIALIWIFFLF